MGPSARWPTMESPVEPANDERGVMAAMVGADRC